MFLAPKNPGCLGTQFRHLKCLLNAVHKFSRPLCQPIRNMKTLYADESCEYCLEAYPILPLRKELKRKKRPDTTKVLRPSCWQALRRSEYKCRSDPEFNVDAFIDANKLCVADPCAFKAPRMDKTHYKPSDKLRRVYQRTWVECVVKRRKQKARCEFKPLKPARRNNSLGENNKIRQRKACPISSSNLGLAVCHSPPRKSRCQRTAMPGCRVARVPPKCQRGRAPVQCRKRLTKYPSFSECLMDPLPDFPPIECNCLQRPSMCSVWEYYRNKKS